MSAHFEIRFITPEEYGQWDTFVDESPQGTIFSKTYWLTCLSETFKIIGCFRGNELMGGIPYEEKRIVVFDTVRIPKITQFLGIHFALNKKMNEVKRRSLENEIQTHLLDFLEKRYSRIAINNHYSIQDIRVFNWRKYRSIVRYSYLVDLSDLNAIYDRMEQRTKHDIKRGEKSGLYVNFNDDIQAFHELHESTYVRQRMKNPVPFHLLKRIHSKLSTSEMCRLYFVKDQGKNVLATAFILFDKTTAYYLLGAVNQEFRKMGAANLLLWQVIKDMGKEGRKTLDLYGANTPSIAFFKRGLGGELTAYYRVVKNSSWVFDLMDKGAQFFKIIK